MSQAWTEALPGPLAALLRGRDCRRIERGRHGEWAVLLGAEGWFRVKADRLVALPWQEDSRLCLSALVEGWTERGIRSRVLAHRPGRRAVMLLEGPRGRSVVKVHAKHRSPLERWRAVDGGAAFDIPSIQGFDPQTRALSMQFREGESLHERWKAGRSKADEAVAVAAILDRLEEQPLPGGLPVHGVAEERASLKAQADLSRSLFQELPEEFERILEQTRSTLGRLDAGPSVVGHRDLHDKQILMADPRPVLLDLDLVSAVPIGLDAGNLLAHARLRRLQGAKVDFPDFAASLRAAGKASWCQEDLLRPWRASSLCRLSFVYARRRGGLEFARRLVAEARADLEGRSPFDGSSPCEAL